MSTADVDLEPYRADARALLERLCRQPSVSTQNMGMAEMADLTEKVLREHGFGTRRLPTPTGYPVVYGELAGTSGKTLLLYNHYDVQPPEPLDLWETPPFTPTVRAGKLFARGAADNKAEIAVRLAALAAVRADGPLPFTVKYLIEGEEEMGSPSFAAVLEEHAALLRCDAWLTEGVSLNRQGQPVLVLGAKGILYVELSVREANSDMHSALASIAPSAAWKLVAALHTLRDLGGNVLIEGFSDRIAPQTEALRWAIARLPDDYDALGEELGLRGWIGDLSGSARVERALTAPTANLAGLTSGYQAPGMKTVLPATASCKMDLRLVPDQDPDDVLAKLRAHLDRHGFADVTVTRLAAQPPAHADLSDAFVGFIASVAREYDEAEPVVYPWIGGTLPLAPMFRRLGPHGLSAPTNATYWGGSAHAPNEHVRLADLDRAVGFNEALFRRYGETGPGGF